MRSFQSLPSPPANFPPSPPPPSQEVVLTSHYLGLVMEYAPGGSLTQYVTRKWKETG
jgi:hypothetical protein